MAYHKEHVLYCAIKNTVANTVSVAHNRKVESNTVKYTNAVLYSDWLRVFWYGLKHTICVCSCILSLCIATCKIM